jgi:hypothetical protein
MIKKLRVISSFGLVLLIGMMITTSACGEGLGGKYTVRYEVSGSAVEVSYRTAEGDQHQYISAPWSYELGTDNEEQLVSLRAKSGSGTVYVKIYLNGELAVSDSEPGGGYWAITGTYKISELL